MVYNLEYSLLDSINRSTKFKHVGVFATMEDVENAKQEIVKQEKERNVQFSIYLINNLFEKITQS